MKTDFYSEDKYTVAGLSKEQRTALADKLLETLRQNDDLKDFVPRTNPECFQCYKIIDGLVFDIASGNGRRLRELFNTAGNEAPTVEYVVKKILSDRWLSNLLDTSRVYSGPKNRDRRDALLKAPINALTDDNIKAVYSVRGVGLKSFVQLISLGLVYDAIKENIANGHPPPAFDMAYQVKTALTTRIKSTREELMDVAIKGAEEILKRHGFSEKLIASARSNAEVQGALATLICSKATPR